jgi:hypothetical protein
MPPKRSVDAARAEVFALLAESAASGRLDEVLQNVVASRIGHTPAPPVVGAPSATGEAPVVGAPSATGEGDGAPMKKEMSKWEKLERHTKNLKELQALREEIKKFGGKKRNEMTPEEREEYSELTAKFAHLSMEGPELYPDEFRYNITLKCVQPGFEKETTPCVLKVYELREEVFEEWNEPSLETPFRAVFKGEVIHTWRNVEDTTEESVTALELLHDFGVREGDTIFVEWLLPVVGAPSATGAAPVVGAPSATGAAPVVGAPSATGAAETQGESDFERNFERDLGTVGRALMALDPVQGAAAFGEVCEILLNIKGKGKGKGKGYP